ncbi:hypothetical protein ACWF50_19575 [Brucella pseudogrignonensis]|jgi:hypothetical protein
MIEQPGVYVAFDRFGVHFAYARHPDSAGCTGRGSEQAARIEAMTAEAILRGGKVVHLSLEAFDRLILFKAKLEGPTTEQAKAAILEPA